MKRIFLISALLINAIVLFGQNTNGNWQQTNLPGNPNAISDAPGSVRGRLGVISGSFADTSAANVNLKTNSVAGTQIWNTTTKSYWFWNGNRWIEISPVTANCQPSLIGSASWSGVGLIYNVTALTYNLPINNCVFYNTAATTETLSTADPLLDRVDEIVCDISSTVNVLTGVPGSGSGIPLNPFTQRLVATITVKGGATTPSGTSSTIVYNTNTEWSGSSNVSVIDFASATSPCVSPLSVLITNPTDGQYVQFQNGVPLPVNNNIVLTYKVKLNSAVTGTPVSYMTVTLFDGTTQTSQPFQVANGSYGFNAATLNTCQDITIPISGLFNIPTFDRIKIVFNGLSATQFQIDYVVLTFGAAPPPPVSNAILVGGQDFTGNTYPRFGSISHDSLTVIGGNKAILTFPPDSLPIVTDSTWRVLLWNPNDPKHAIAQNYYPTIFASTCIQIFDSVGKRWIRDTCSGGGGTGTPFGYTFSSTAPADTSVGWINTSVNIYNCYPIQYHSNGQWNAVDTIAGQFYDNVGKVFTRGYPYVIVATGQSNLGGSYVGEQSNPNAPPYNGYYGDTIPAPSVAAWNNNQNIWVVAQIRDTPFQYSSGANYLLLMAKNLTKQTGRSIRIVTYPQGGTGLQCWAGVPGTPPQDSACYIEFTNRITASGVHNPDLFIWAQSEAGITPAPTPTTYYDKLYELIDTLRNRGYIDTTTLITMMGSGDTTYGEKYALGNGTGGGEGALRAFGANNDRYIKYVDVIGAQSDGLHFTAKGHEEIARRLFYTVWTGQKNPAIDQMGYGGLYASKLLSSIQSTVQDGLVYTDLSGNPYIQLSDSLGKTTYGDARANGSSQRHARLEFNNIVSDDVRLYHYNGTTKLQLEDTRILSSTPLVAFSEVQAYSGADAFFSISDIMTGGIWKIQNIGTDNRLAYKFNNVDKVLIKTTGQFGIGVNPDSTLQINGSLYNTGGVRFSGIPSSNNANDSALVWNPTTGTVGYRAISTGGSGGWTDTLTNTAITSGVKDVFIPKNLTVSGNVGIGTGFDPSGTLSVLTPNGKNQIYASDDYVFLGDINTDVFSGIILTRSAKSMNLAVNEGAQQIYISPAGTAITGDMSVSGTINGVKKYVALLTQSGTSAPVATVLENSLGGTVVWSYNSAGMYIGTLTGAFTSSKTFVVINNTNNNAWSYGDGAATYADWIDADTIRITTAAGGAATDEVMINTSIEIRVYP